MKELLTLKQLQCFITVAETLNFRVAAERLYMTQPPLSRMIKKLEDQLGIQLFQRDTKGVEITPIGKLFLKEAQQLLRHSDEIVATFKDYKVDSALVLNIGVTTVSDQQFFLNFISFFQNRYPNVVINIKPDLSINIIKQIKQGTLDIALIGMPSHTDGLTVTHFYREPVSVAISSSSHLRDKVAIDLADLHKENLFLFERTLNPTYYDLCLNIFKELKLEPNFIAEPKDHHILLNLIANNYGIGLISNSLTYIKHEKVIYKPLVNSDRLSIDLSIVHKKEGLSDSAHLFLLMLLDYKI